jgi:hypothetical protein
MAVMELVRKRSTLWNIWAGALVVFFFTFAVGLAYVYFTTPPLPGVTPSNCDRIWQGMEEDEVARLMGCGADKESLARYGRPHIYRAYYRGQEGVVVVEYRLKDAKSDWRDSCVGVVLSAEWIPNSSFIRV